MADLFDTLELDRPVTTRRVGDFTLFAGIPVGKEQTERLKRGWACADLPFEHMLVGECFNVFAPNGRSLIETQNHVSGAAATFRKTRPGWRFTTRQMNRCYVRCWRIA